MLDPFNHAFGLARALEAMGPSAFRQREMNNASRNLIQLAGKNARPIIRFGFGWHHWGVYWFIAFWCAALFSLDLWNHAVLGETVKGTVLRNAEVAYGDASLGGRPTGRGSGGYISNNWYLDVEVQFQRNGALKTTRYVWHNVRFGEFRSVQERLARKLTQGAQVDVYVRRDGVATLQWWPTYKGFTYWIVIPFFVCLGISIFQRHRSLIGP
jgi:hypothetical protein